MFGRALHSGRPSPTPKLAETMGIDVWRLGLWEKLPCEHERETLQQNKMLGTGFLIYDGSSV